ncbi:MAG: S1C family serine protease [Acidimicrobiales bacterium]
MSTIFELGVAAAAVVDKLQASVVGIGQDGRGTGLVVGPGKVLTNAHNLRDRTTTVSFADGRRAPAALAGADADGDLVVLDVDTADAPAATWSEEAVGAGAVVFSLSRGGHRTRVSFGMVAAVDQAFSGPRGREIRGGIEHSAPLARGSSGGPVVDGQGRVLAINTHRSGPFYLARPVDEALRATITTLASGVSIERPRLGVALAPPEVAAKLRASVGLAARTGLLVREVQPGGAAAGAGIAAGDLLVTAAGQALSDIAALNEVLTPGLERLTLQVVRGTEERDVEVHFTAEAQGTGTPTSTD